MRAIGMRPWRRLITSAVFIAGAVTLTATASPGQTPFTPPDMPANYTPLELPACQKQGQPFKVDLSTMSGITSPAVDTPDPHWLVTGPGIGPPIPPYYTTLSAWTAQPPSWVEPIKAASNGSANSNAQSGDYTYTIWFKLNCPPESYSNLQIIGTFAADNSATVYLNAFPVKSCVGGTCFPSATAFTATAPFQGTNSLSVVVHNDDLYTGMTIKAELSGSCIGNQCVKESGLLKVCKVAGIGVPLGTPFSFTANGSAPFAVPAGAAPGGACVVGPRFLSGTHVTVKEVGPLGYSVSNITVLPPQTVTPTLGVNGSVTVTMGTGVTETTFTDKAYAYSDKTGMLEICKVGPDQGNFSFTVSPGALGPFTVPAGSCSAAIEVPAGPVDITEMPTKGFTMLGCATIPAANQLGCDPSKQISTVQVGAGNASTIAYISDGRTADTGGGGHVGMGDQSETGRQR
jgi:hypothetical protein